MPPSRGKAGSLSWKQLPHTTREEPLRWPSFMFLLDFPWTQPWNILLSKNSKTGCQSWGLILQMCCTQALWGIVSWFILWIVTKNCPESSEAAATRNFCFIGNHFWLATPNVYQRHLHLECIIMAQKRCNKNVCHHSQIQHCQEQGWLVY